MSFKFKNKKKYLLFIPIIFLGFTLFALHYISGFGDCKLGEWKFEKDLNKPFCSNLITGNIYRPRHLKEYNLQDFPRTHYLSFLLPYEGYSARLTEYGNNSQVEVFNKLDEKIISFQTIVDTKGLLSEFVDREIKSLKESSTPQAIFLQDKTPLKPNARGHQGYSIIVEGYGTWKYTYINWSPIGYVKITTPETLSELDTFVVENILDSLEQSFKISY